MDTRIVVTESVHEDLHGLQDEIQGRGLHLALPPAGEDNIVCLDPKDKATPSRFVCLWKGGKSIHKPECPIGTKVAVEW